MIGGRNSIKNRVRAVILLSSVIVLLTTALAFLVYEVLSFERQLLRSVKTLAAIMADNTAVALVFDQPERAADMLDSLVVEPEIVAAVVHNLEGERFATYPTNLPPRYFEKRSSGQGYEFGKDSLTVFEPIMQEGKQVGTLYLRSSLQAHTARMRNYLGITVLVLTGSMAAAYVLSNVLQRQISNPILALTATTQRIAENKDYSVRVPKLTKDELGILTDAFNHMLERTQQDQQQLTEQARLLDLSNDAIIVLAMDDRILYWNRGAEGIYGWTVAEAVGRKYDELLRTRFPESRAAIALALERDGRWSGDLIQSRRDGEQIHAITRWVLDRRSAGGAGRVLISENDITLRKHAEEVIRSEAVRLDALVAQRTAKLQETIGELEAFSYSISHDMRAPLRAMHGYARALLDDYQDKLDEDGRSYLDRIGRAATRLDALIQDVLAYSRVAKGDIDLHPVNLAGLIEDIVPNHPEFQRPRAEVTWDSLRPVMGHEAYLTQCITNLLGNAVKFVEPGTTPRVRIWSEPVGDSVRIWFEDNGIGIEPAHHERIFQIFGQVYGEKKYGGTGIGLAIVRKAVQRMNGTVGLESELGKGTRFWIMLKGTEMQNS